MKSKKKKRSSKSASGEEGCQQKNERVAKQKKERFLQESNPFEESSDSQSLEESSNERHRDDVPSVEPIGSVLNLGRDTSDEAGAKSRISKLNSASGNACALDLSSVIDNHPETNSSAYQKPDELALKEMPENTTRQHARSQSTSSVFGSQRHSPPMPIVSDSKSVNGSDRDTQTERHFNSSRGERDLELNPTFSPRRVASSPRILDESSKSKDFSAKNTFLEHKALIEDVLEEVRQNRAEIEDLQNKMNEQSKASRSTFQRLIHATDMISNISRGAQYHLKDWLSLPDQITPPVDERPKKRGAFASLCVCCNSEGGDGYESLRKEEEEELLALDREEEGESEFDSQANCFSCFV